MMLRASKQRETAAQAAAVNPVRTLVTMLRKIQGEIEAEDVVTIIAALERLIFDESIDLLSSAYVVNGESVETTIDEHSIYEVLRSYLLIFRSSNRKKPYQSRVSPAGQGRFDNKQ